MKPPARRGLLALLLAPALGARRNATAGNSGAVTKVVQLLQNLQARIEKDGEEEQSIYNKFACWCEAITAKKAASIKELQTELGSLGNTILQLKGTVATTISEIKGLTEDIYKNEMNQKTATAIRQKENAAFMAEKVELEQAITALEGAITVLRDGTKAMSLLHRGGVGSRGTAAVAALTRLHAPLSAAVARLPTEARPDTTQLAALESAAAGRRYAPQSLTIQGILHNMYDTFTTNLESQTHDEGTAHRNYETLMATWQSELLALQGTILTKEQAKAEAETMLADATQSYADSEVQLTATISFFDTTKASCLAKTDDWAARKALRREELDGISQALAILTDEAAKDLFAKAVTPGFATLLQEDAFHGNNPLAQARDTLQAHARQSHSLRLAALAAAMGAGGRLRDVGHFDDVVRAIDTLLATLQQEEAADKSKVSTCKDQYQSNALEVQDIEWKIRKNKAHIQKLEGVVTKQEAEKSAALADLESIEKDINDTKAMRLEENTRFQQAKTDDEQAILLLKKARAALMQYFTNHSIDLGPIQSLVQDSTGHSLLRNSTNLTDTPPEVKFSGGDKRKTESKGIVSLLTLIIEDLEAEIVNGVRAEEAAHVDYEHRLTASEAVAQGLRRKITDLTESIALRNQDITDEEAAQTGNEGALANLESTKNDIKADCDWIIKHQAERQQKRALEAEGLRRAKEYLAGAGLPSALQRLPAGAVTNGFPRIDFSSVSFLQR